VMDESYAADREPTCSVAAGSSNSEVSNRHSPICTAPFHELNWDSVDTYMSFMIDSMLAWN
jgi:hypothetical protein